MEILEIAVSKVKPAAYNPRKELQTTDPAYQRLKNAVDKFGMVEPLVWNKRTGNLVGGHQRFNILKGRGDRKVTVSVVDLDDQEEKALNLALNKHDGQWDVQALASLVQELKVTGFDLDLTGFDATELTQLEVGTPLNQGQVERVLLASLVTDTRNVRKHDVRSLETIKLSLQRYGQQKPIVVTRRDRMVRAGNGTYEAARNLGWHHILVQWSDLSEQDASAFAIQDNRSTDVSSFDTQELSMALQALTASGYDITTLGWRDYELEPLLRANWTPPAVGDLTEFKVPDHGTPMHFTKEQREIVDRAVLKIRTAEGDMTEGRAVELICAEFLS